MTKINASFALLQLIVKDVDLDLMNFSMMD